MLSETRKVLGGSWTIRHRQGVYGLSPELRLELDTERFDAAWEARPGPDAPAERRLDGLRPLWAMYAGPLLEGFDEPWLLPLRDRFHDRYLQVLAECGRCAVAVGDHTLAVDAFRSLLLAEPFDEDAHVALMDLYGEAGRRDLVRAQFIRLQDRLKELHVDPSPRAMEIYDRWMA